MPALTDSQFKEQFRLSRAAVARILEQLEEDVNTRNAENDIPLEEKLLVWSLVSREHYQL